MTNNPLAINDWAIGKFLKTIFAILLIVLILAILGALGYDIPILRQIVAFVFLSFIPGLIILRILRLHRLGLAETLLYSVGLSLAFTMFLGLLINSIYPFIGISKPISIWPLVITLLAVLILLCYIAYRRDKMFSTPGHFHWTQLLTPPVLFLSLLPLISILGARIVNIYSNNILLLASVLLVALVPVIIIFTKFIPQRFYPLAVITVALALVYGQALTSNYLTGADVNTEYFFDNLVIANSLWNTTIVHNYNSVISVVILAPVYSIICNLEPTWVFKLIYLFFLSLVPLGIYQICSRQIDSKISFLAAFFFMSVFTFFIVLISLGRQEVAEVFLVLIILVIVSKPNNPVIISILCIIFGAALIFSHYSISFIFLFLLLAALLILFLSRKTLSRGSPNESENTNELIPRRSQTTKSIPIERNKVINITFVAFYIILWFTWYIWNAGSSVFVDVIRLGDHIANTFVVEFMSLTASQALWLMATVGSPAHEIVKYLNLFTIFLISVGTLYLLFEWRKKIFTEEFASLAVASFIMAAIAIPIPYLAKTINTERIYHLSLVFLAPFCITGLIIIVNFFLRRYRSATGVALKTMAIFLGVFLIFNSGFVHEITRDYTFMGSLLQQSIKEHGTIEEKAYFYNNSTPEEEVYSAKWLSANRSWLDGPKVYATFVEGANVHVLAGYGMVPQWKIIPLNKNTQNIGRGEYVYLGYINVVDGVGTMVIPPTFLKVETFNIQELNPLLEKTDRIYSNNESELFVMP